MSDRLAFAATASVLMMAGYVLLGGQAVRAPIGPTRIAAGATIPASGLVPALPRAEELVPFTR